MRLERACCRLLVNKHRILQLPVVARQPATVIRVEVAPNLLPTLSPPPPRSRQEIQELLDEGRISLDSAEGAMGMAGAGDGFPTPTGV